MNSFTYSGLNSLLTGGLNIVDAVSIGDIFLKISYKIIKFVES